MPKKEVEEVVGKTPKVILYCQRINTFWIIPINGKPQSFGSNLQSKLLKICTTCT